MTELLNRVARAAPLALACTLTKAGSVEGPYLVWMNLGGAAHAQADEAVRAFVNGTERLCWPEHALLYMRKRPAAVTPSLVRRALVQHDAAARHALRSDTGKLAWGPVFCNVMPPVLRKP